MSLVAAVAVAGMTTAQAKDLTEAIKGVDVSGTVVYRYNDYGNGEAASDTANFYKIGVSLSSPVNDVVKANTRFLVADANGHFVNGGATGLDTNEDGDSNPEVTLSQVNFAYSGIANTTVIVGKQGIATPWTNAIDSDGSEQTGTGILALTTMGPVTAAAGYMNQTNFDTIKVQVNSDTTAQVDAGLGDGSRDTIVAALMAKFGPIATEAWYLNIDEVADSYFLKASGSFKVSDVALKVFAQYNDMDADSDFTADDDDLSLFKAGISAKMGLFNAGVNYGKTGDNGTGVVNALAKNGMIGWNTSIHDHYDADMIQVDLGMQVTPELHVGLNYDEIDTNSTVDADETDIFVQATYKMSKNFMTYVRLGEYEVDNTTTDGTRGRLQVQYSF